MSFLSDLGLKTGNYMPDVSGLGSSLVNIGIVIVIMVALAGAGYWWWDRSRYRYKIEIYENLGGTRYVKTGTDLARIQKLGNQGEEILILKRRKKIVTSYNRKMGTNLLWFAVGQDGTWVNVTLGDLDAKQGMLDIEPVDRDMRYAHVSLRKSFDNEFNKPKFMEKYGSYIMMGIFLIIIIVGIGYLVNKMAIAAGTLAATADSNRLVLDGLHQVLTSMDNICSGSGIIVT